MKKKTEVFVSWLILTRDAHVKDFWFALAFITKLTSSVSHSDM